MNNLRIKNIHFYFEKAIKVIIFATSTREKQSSPPLAPREAGAFSEREAHETPTSVNDSGIEMPEIQKRNKARRGSADPERLRLFCLHHENYKKRPRRGEQRGKLSRRQNTKKVSKIFYTSTLK